MRMPRFGLSGAPMRNPRLGQGRDSCPYERPRPVFRPMGYLGQGQSTASAVTGEVGSIATTGLTTAAVIGGVGSTAAMLAATAIPLVGIAVAVVALCLKFFGHGCGNACTETAKLHQVVSATEDNIIAACLNGYISGPEAQTALQGLINTGDQIEEQASQYPQQVANSIQQFTSNIQSSIPGLSSQPATPSKTWDPNAVQALFVGGAGWYPDSIAQANNLSMQILQSIITNRSSATTSAGGVTGSIMSAVGGLPTWALVAAAGVGALLLFGGGSK